MLDVGYRTEVKLNMVLLDWEKAFDKIDHEAMHNALYRMNLPEKYLSLIRQVYKKPTFKMEMFYSISRII